MELAKLLKQITPAVLAHSFRLETIKRGQAYVGRVSTVETAGMTISGKVQGSDFHPYATSVTLSSRLVEGEPVFFRSAHCSCPVGQFCKHAVALVLAAQKQGITEKPRAQVIEWTQQLAGKVAEGASKTRKPVARRESIIYIVSIPPHKNTPELMLCKALLDADGGLRGQPKEWFNYEQALLKPPSFVAEEDLPIFRQIRDIARKQVIYGPLRFRGESGQALLDAILATGRGWLGDEKTQALCALRATEARPGRLVWMPGERGISPAITTQPPAGLILPLSPAYYIDAATGEAGPVDLGLGTQAQRTVESLFDLPPLSEVELPLVAAALEEVAPALPSPLLASQSSLPVIEAPLVPVLRLNTISTWGMRAYRKYPTAYGMVDFDYAEPCFRYGDARLSIQDEGMLAALPDGRHARIKRAPEAEATALKALKKAGFLAAKVNFISSEQLPAGAHGLDSEQSWKEFFDQIAPALRAAGWQIECPANFRHKVLEVSVWDAELSESENGWFDLALGIEVEGQKLELAPLLSALFHSDARWLERQALELIDDAEKVILRTPDGSRIQVDAARIKPLARTMIDLFDGIPTGESALRVSRFDAERVSSALQDGWQTDGLAALAQWQDKLRGMREVAPVSEPNGFGLTLRGYQREGLAWLQHLRQHELAGILADDMGLGKTAQTLAHILIEKQAGRLDKPVLVVLPTSLIFNWQREAERFAPELKILKLQGPDRHEAFARIPGHDVCLTTYPLLARDEEHLAAHDYHTLILDEAQTVKNAVSKAAQVIRHLKARHRLCLTGTPLENHLGELWALFDFLMPGFLGDARDFTNRWRTPIEKHGNALRREVLVKRIAPFILRRRKQDVAKELPPKTTVIRTVELEGRQRDLYETVRSAMDKRVRDEIAQKGFARSQIIILDALLKLRQICCDPRLLKMDAAAKVKERAKLDLLMDMLPELVEEGRKVLVFSQFTSMLALIEAELAKLKIPYSLLTGDTQDRESAIRGFQEGDNPVFLISLKAGGVGLNLTAADTVIHFDPWWNPAVENQATDRAHRIGQTRNVFVYKLVVAGSIEERILTLQEKKADLAASILSEDHEGQTKFAEDDIRNLLAPLPEK
ncbi:MAG: box helicase family protein [Proteobacteria bacterium]|nr:box helicase family protein [Pseudomonadota bacterium]